MVSNFGIASAIAGFVVAASPVAAFAPTRSLTRPSFTRVASTTQENKNVAQTENTSREEIMTFSYDMSLEPKYEKPTYPGTGNGLNGS